MPSADLFLSVAAFGTDPLLLRVDVQNDVTDPDGVRIDASIDGTAGSMAISGVAMAAARLWCSSASASSFSRKRASI